MVKHSHRVPPSIEDVAAFNEYMTELHENIYGDADNDGSLDGDNVTGATDPGVADGTVASATSVLNDLVDNLQETGIVEG